MPDSQSSESGFESLFVTVSKIGHFRSLHWRPSWLSCINEYLAIDSGGNVSDLAVAPNCCVARMLPGEAELVSEWTGLPGEAKSVKCFERSNGLDTALYKNYLYLFFTLVSSTISLIHFWMLLLRWNMIRIFTFYWLSYSPDICPHPVLHILFLFILPSIFPACVHFSNIWWFLGVWNNMNFAS